MLNKIETGDDNINPRLIATILVLLALTSGTALAGWGDTPSNMASLPPLGAQISAGPEVTQNMAQAAPGGQNYGSNMAAMPMPTDATGLAAYTQAAPPASERQTLLTYNTAAGQMQPVYYSGTYVPWSSFTGGYPGSYPLFWAASQSGWSWYASLPLGAWVQELMFIPVAGSVKVYEIYPTGMTQLTDFGFASPGYKYIWFNGDTAGKHITIFTVGDLPSNAVTIDVGGYQSQVMTGPVYPTSPAGYAVSSASGNAVQESHYSDI